MIVGSDRSKCKKGSAYFSINGIIQDRKYSLTRSLFYVITYPLYFLYLCSRVRRGTFNPDLFFTLNISFTKYINIEDNSYCAYSLIFISCLYMLRVMLFNIFCNAYVLSLGATYFCPYAFWILARSALNF